MREHHHNQLLSLTPSVRPGWSRSVQSHQQHATPSSGLTKEFLYNGRPICTKTHRLQYVKLMMTKYNNLLMSDTIEES